MLYYLIVLILAPVAIYFMGKTRLKSLNQSYGIEKDEPKDGDDNDKA